MPAHAFQIRFFLELLILSSCIFMHLVRKNSSIVLLYMLQSAIIVSLLIIDSMARAGAALIMVIVLTFTVKVVIAPVFFFSLIRRNKLKFSVSTFLNAPLTLIVLAVLIAIAHSQFFNPLTAVLTRGPDTLFLSIAGMLVAFFLIINRKGAMSQMIGVLSLENSMVAFASMTGLEQTAGLQIGIVFDILVWTVIAVVFVSMIYRQYGSLDVSAMKHLRE